MQVSPFLELFVAFFLLLGGVVGWFTRIRILVFLLTLMAIVFVGLVIVSSLHSPAAPELTTDDIYVSALITAFAAAPALLSAAIARVLKTRSSK